MKQIFLILLLSVGCTSRKEEKRDVDPAIPVTTVHPASKEASYSIETLGTLLPNVKAEICPQVAGFVREIFVSEGQTVSAGTSLFCIDATQQKLDLQKAHAELQCAQADHDALQSKAARYSSLAQKDLIAQTEWEELHASAEKAKHTLQLRKVYLQEAQQGVDKCVVTSPIDGRVGKWNIAVGLRVEPQVVCTTVTQSTPLIVECSLTEKEFLLLPKGHTELLVSPLTAPHIVEKGSVTFFDSGFDDKKGLLLLRGIVASDSSPLYPGQIVRVTIPYKRESAVVHIPQKAIRYNTKGPYVYIVTKEMTVESCQLVLGEERGEERIVQEGLTADATLVVDGLARLYSGCSVRVESP